MRAYEVPDRHEDRVADLRERITRVSETSEYPATFILPDRSQYERARLRVGERVRVVLSGSISIWSQLLLSIALPKAVQLVIASL